MRSVISILVIFTCMVGLCSCEDFFETTLELDPPEYEERLVLGAILNNEENTQRIKLSRTVGLTEDPIAIDMTDAQVFLDYPDGRSFEFQNKSRPNDFSFHNFEIWDQPSFIPGSSYKIRATKPGFDTLVAEVMVPEEIPLISAQYKFNGGIDQWGDERSAIDVVFQDPKGKRNFYKAVVIIRESNNANARTSSITTTSLDVAVRESADYRSALIEDISFDGTEKQLRLQFPRVRLSDQEELYIQWNVISEDQYLFDKTLEQFSESRDNPFASPTQLYSNVMNGLGTFAIENRRTYKVNR